MQIADPSFPTRALSQLRICRPLPHLRRGKKKFPSVSEHFKMKKKIIENFFFKVLEIFSKVVQFFSSNFHFLKSFKTYAKNVLLKSDEKIFLHFFFSIFKNFSNTFFQFFFLYNFFFRLKMFWNICNFFYPFWGGGVCISLIGKKPPHVSQFWRYKNKCDEISREKISYF